MNKEVMKQALEALRMPCEFWNKTQFIKVTEAIKALEESLKQKENNFKCKTHPDAPHGFVRNASHSEDRYVCECEFWELPEQDEPEPVAYGFPNSAITGSQKWMLLEEKIPENDQYKGALWIPLYTKPQNKEWVGLTDEQIVDLVIKNAGFPTKLAEAIQAKLKEKNAF